MSALGDKAQAEAAGAGNNRRSRRLRPPMHCYWGATESCTRGGKITSMSPDGCFVQTKAEAADGQELFVNCWLPTERWLMLRARVKYSLPKVGLALAFVGVTEAEAELLSMLLDSHGQESAPPPAEE